MMNTMTVGELKALLDGHDDDLLVVAAVNYGDRARTLQAVELGRVQASGEVVTLTETAYSSSGYAVPDDDRECRDCGGYGFECECESADASPAIRALVI